jgi:hypothetical protein
MDFIGIVPLSCPSKTPDGLALSSGLPVRGFGEKEE